VQATTALPHHIACGYATMLSSFLLDNGAAEPRSAQLALCPPGVTNMHMLNCAGKRFIQLTSHLKAPPKLKRLCLFFVPVTNLNFDSHFLPFLFFSFISSRSRSNSNSNMAKDLSTMGWDYLMFVLFIALTVLGPLWKRIFGKKKERSKADYVFATGGVSIVAVMISIARGTLGVRSVLGEF